MGDRRISAINRTLVSGREILTPLLSPVQLLSYYHVLHDSHRLRQTQYTLGHSKNTSWRMTVTYQSSINYQPKQYTFIRELPQNYHISKFALFDPPEMDNNDPCILQVKYPGYTIWRKLNPQVSSFFFACCNMFESLPSLKLTVRTWNAGVGSDEFPFGAGPPGGAMLALGSVINFNLFICLFCTSNLSSGINWCTTWHQDLSSQSDEALKLGTRSFSLSRRWEWTKKNTIFWRKTLKESILEKHWTSWISFVVRFWWGVHLIQPKGQEINGLKLFFRSNKIYVNIQSPKVQRLAIGCRKKNLEFMKLIFDWDVGSFLMLCYKVW